MIFISILIAIQLSGLLALATYAYRFRTRTKVFDGFTLLRLGMTIAEDMPLIPSVDADETAVLNEREGWLDETGGDNSLEIVGAW